MSFMDTARILGNLGEFVGAIVIIATLIYLAMQVRQNSELIRVNAVTTDLQLTNSMVVTITGSRECAEYWLKGESEFESLDDVDRARLLFHEGVGIIIWHNAFELRQRSLLSDESWRRILFQIGAVKHRQSVRAAWQWTKGGFGQPFPDFMNKNLGLPTAGP